MEKKLSEGELRTLRAFPYWLVTDRWNERQRNHEHKVAEAVKPRRPPPIEVALHAEE